MTNLALVLFKQDKLEKCIEICNQALELDHRCIKAIFWKARATAEDAEYDDAIKIFNELLEIDPTHGEAKKWLQHTVQRNETYKNKIKLLA